MDFMSAVKVCLTEKYCSFNGRASRSEFWWFMLASLIIAFVAGFVSGKLGIIAVIALTLPIVSASVRRLHDTNRSGWFYFIGLIPLVGLCLYFVLAQKGTEGPNRFGEDPLEND